MEHKLVSHALDGEPLLLKNHTDQVIKATEYLVNKKILNFKGLSKDQIKELSILIASCHDFGKSTSFFQVYIKSGLNNVRYTGNEKKKSHALISAFFGCYMLEKWLSKNQIESHWTSFLPFAVFVAIEGHHTSHKSIEDIIKETDSNFELIEEQIEEINQEIFNYEFGQFKFSECSDFDIKKVESIASKFRKLNREYSRVPPGYDKEKWLDVQIEHRLLALFLYSILLESDKAYLASDNSDEYEREHIEIPDTLVDEYIKTLEKNRPIDAERQKAYKETTSKVNDFSLDSRIHSITLPTGLGKTLLAASWALKLRKRIQKEGGFTPQIIVSLPFLSIIEQTDIEYKKFLGQYYKDHLDRLYMPRYSIADFQYRNGNDDKERSDNSVDFSLNVWNSEIIVSTFDQLFYSAFSLKSKHLMRFHNLFNSIIIFDETQAVPTELWKPFEHFFRKIAEVGNTHIVLMSATQPKFFSSAVERVPKNEAYFENRERVDIHVKPSNEPLESFLEELSKTLKHKEDKSIMIVLNTRESSKFIYKEVKKWMDEGTVSKRPLIYLSSLVTPSQRIERIKEIKTHIDNRNNPVIVTTQCIEAGVDIDIDYVIRDFAPMDSLFQVCGRCNRNGEKEKGVVTFIKLISEKPKLPTKIYDSIRLDCTSKCIATNRHDGNSLIITEKEFYNLGSNYFSLIRPLLGQSMKIVNAYSEYTHKYEKKGKEVKVSIKKLLRGDESKEQFIVSSLDKNLVKEIREALEIKDRWKRRYAMKRLSKRIAANSVSVSFNWTVNSPDIITKEKIGHFRVLDEKFYDENGVGLDVDLKKSIGGSIIF
jgi:CRISPR-associated endonuclease/helicase Cas3